MSKRKNGDGNWGVRTINGAQYKYYRKYYDWKGDYHTFYGKTEKEINQKKERFELKNKDKHKLDLKNIPKESFYYYCKHWIDNIKPFDGTSTKQVTIDSYKDIVENRIKDTFLGNAQIGSLNKKIFQDYISDYCVNEKKYSRATIKRTQSLLNQICEYLCKKDHYSNINYMEDIIIPSEKNVSTKKKTVPFLEQSDMEKLYDEFNKLDGNGNKIYGINSYAIIFIMYTGLRISECISLKWKDVNFDLNIVNISHVIVKVKNTKSDTPKYVLVDTEGTKSETSNRSIPLSDVALSILKELRVNQNDNEYIFSNDGKTVLDNRNVTRTLNIMQRNSKCKVEKCGLHSLRHTFGSYLILKGTDVKTVSELLGHSSIEVTLNIYIHIINAQKAASIKLFDDINTNIISVTDKQDDNNVIDNLSKLGVSIIEIEDGMLGYIENNKIVKLPINKTLLLDTVSINNIDIYNDFYKNIKSQ